MTTVMTEIRTRMDVGEAMELALFIGWVVFAFALGVAVGLARSISVIAKYKAIMIAALCTKEQ